MKKILHSLCNGLIGRYDDDALMDCTKMEADKYDRVGVQAKPQKGDKIREKCPVCGRYILSWEEMVIAPDKEKNVWN